MDDHFVVCEWERDGGLTPVGGACDEGEETPFQIGRIPVGYSAFEYESE